MLFNSFEFAVFFPLVFIAYWFLLNRNLRLQNTFLLVVSYFFYGWWDWRFVFLLILSTLIDYGFGLIIHRSEKHKKLYLWISIVNNLAILGFFKYYNFFAESVQQGLHSMGFEANIFLLSIALPVGISFYTFHGMSYVVDIYYGRSKPITNFVDYAVFVCFFPLLVAGPIERANHLLPQVIKPRQFNLHQGLDGLRFIVWGLFKKVVIADNLAPYVNDVFANYTTVSSFELVMGAIFFAFQIYCDFSGYSDIAIGTAKLLGFELMVNFRSPYFSRDIAEFWRRWHISLSSWFRDYLYIPLGGSKGGKGMAVRNTFIIFLVSGFWHGANWTFIAWGFLNALFFLPLLLGGRHRSNLDVVAENRMLPTGKELLQMVLTFLLVSVAWIFFRAATIGHAFDYIGSMFTNDFMPESLSRFKLWLPPVLVAWIIAEWAGRRTSVPETLGTIPYATARRLVYFALLMLVGFYGAFQKTEFIYFQF